MIGRFVEPKRESDKMKKDNPPYYPVPGDVLKDKNLVLEDRPWMQKVFTNSVNVDDLTWDHFLLV
jgi:hypothetical protein